MSRHKMETGVSITTVEYDFGDTIRMFNIGTLISYDNIIDINNDIVDFIQEHDYIVLCKSESSAFDMIATSQYKDVREIGHVDIDVARVRNSKGVKSMITTFGTVEFRISVDDTIIITDDMVVVERMETLNRGTAQETYRYDRIGLMTWYAPKRK